MKIQNVAILGALTTVLITGSVFASQSEMVLSLRDGIKVTLSSPNYINMANDMLSSAEDIKIEEVLSNHQATFTNENIGGAAIAAHMEGYINLDVDGNYNINHVGLTKDELNIPLEGNKGVYISNMALVDNLLHVQLRAEKTEGTGIIKLVNQEENIVNVNTHAAQLMLSSGEEGTTYSEFIFYIENPEDIGDYKIVVK